MGMVNLNRDVFCLLGLPLDVMTMQQTVAEVRRAVQTRQRLFLTTPNLNFLIASQSDQAFSQTVIDSDLCIADGMPLVWMSRMLGVPVPERVTGSGLFQNLWESAPPAGVAPIKVYFFGGLPGAAQTASNRLNERPGGLVCVGFETPGFGSVQDMSDQGVLDRINASDADFLIVAIGTKKGQMWIQRNRGDLKTPVISYLGAVVNFAAGTVNRAPLWVQRTGLEWLWRIKEEPTLWKRYWDDATALSSLFARQVWPLSRLVSKQRQVVQAAHADVQNSIDEQGCRLKVIGSIPDVIPDQVRSAMVSVYQQAGHVTLDLSQCIMIGPRFAGLLLLWTNALEEKYRTFKAVGLSPEVQRQCQWNGVDLLHSRQRAPSN